MKFLTIILCVFLIFVTTHFSEARPMTGTASPAEDPEQEAPLNELAVGVLLNKWVGAVQKRDRTEKALSRLIEEATLKGISPELENKIIQVRNRKMDAIRDIADLESEIDSRKTLPWAASDSPEVAQQKKFSAMMMNAAFNGMRRDVGVPVMSYWDSSKPKNTAFGIDDMFQEPRIFRNMYYFLENADLRENFIAGVMITRTPPVNRRGAIGFKRVGSLSEMFGVSAGEGPKFDPPKYVLYISPDASYEDLMRDYEQIADLIMLEQRGHAAETVAETGVYNACDNLKKAMEDQGSYVEDMGDLLDQMDKLTGMSSETETLEDVLNKYRDLLSTEDKQQFEKLNLNQSTILNYLNRALDHYMTSANDTQGIQKLQNAIYQMQVNQLPGNTYLTMGLNNTDPNKTHLVINGLFVPLYDIAIVK
ncbi:MAG: hypothetical protein A2Z91_05690 [Deltaproteobacteria bacterium GWA2_38_16]|nr:MAG: hypothetical protein A2Z91_05690 [Deltaproteobacteria bacterium GWA2_38_16]OGQ02604.1 MAG: hypothetical protein A3D19_04985 [Deltaproteobacteria bacterium RIFCSPHIGHO2_02_FULL_38_15]OGQ33790.1 MAG: hypothetical protein A3A72_03220 [Deltaproteobacteria bacterium RIFCSPLOWO2_01_FULL_38_9]HBQ20302.1 hypothetical protein [Deltaproteobacteria bacterium]